MNAERFRLRAAELVEYCREHGYNTRIALLWKTAQNISSWRVTGAAADELTSRAHTRARRTSTDRTSAPKGGL